MWNKPKNYKKLFSFLSNLQTYCPRNYVWTWVNITSGPLYIGSVFANRVVVITYLSFVNPSFRQLPTVFFPINVIIVYSLVFPDHHGVRGMSILLCIAVWLVIVAVCNIVGIHWFRCLVHVCSPRLSVNILKSTVYSFHRKCYLKFGLYME